jgi:hypothetical protein
MFVFLVLDDTENTMPSFLTQLKHKERPACAGRMVSEGGSALRCLFYVAACICCISWGPYWLILPYWEA